jgi:hypothetical protein
MTVLADAHQDRRLTGRASDMVSAVAMDYPPRQRYEAVTGARSAEFRAIMVPAEIPADGDAVKSTPNARERLRTKCPRPCSSHRSRPQFHRPSLLRACGSSDRAADIINSVAVERRARWQCRRDAGIGRLLHEPIVDREAGIAATDEFTAIFWIRARDFLRVAP